MTIPGVGPFVAVAIKARIGDIRRFPDKQKFCSYAGIVPKADNSGEHVSKHNRLKHGDNVLKNALTIAVRGAVKTKKGNSIKRRYIKAIRKGKAPQDAEVVAAKKLADIVWGMLTKREAYIDEDKVLTYKKSRALSSFQKIKQPDKTKIIERLKNSEDIIAQGKGYKTGDG
jgi:hypothetical protein